MSVEALGDYLSYFMKYLITDTIYQRGPDGKYHHYQEPCNRLADYITRHVPPFYASEVTQRLVRYVVIRYVILIHGAFRSACEEIAPYVLKAVIHPSVKCLDFIRDSSHPTLLDYYKEIESELIYKTLPLLKDLITVRLGKSVRIINVPLEVEGFRNTLEEFCCREFWERDLALLAHKCKHVARLDIGVSIDYLSRAFCYISRFKYLEELNLSRIRNLPENELQRILLWLAGVLPSEESSEEREDILAYSASSSQESGNTSAAESSRTLPACCPGAESSRTLPARCPDAESSRTLPARCPGAESSRTLRARCPGLLKSFGCSNAIDPHINLISQFYNLTSLVLANVSRVRTLAPLSHLKMLKNFTLIRTAFIFGQEVLKSIGNQLICLKFVDVWNTDFSFISHHCRSLECLHLYFSYSYKLILPPNYLNPESHSLPLPDFPHVVTLQLYLTEDLARNYVLSRFRNLKKLSLVSTGGDVLLLQSLMQRRLITRLEELYWGYDTVILFNGSTATKTVFHLGGQVTVQHIRT